MRQQLKEQLESILKGFENAEKSRVTEDHRDMSETISFDYTSVPSNENSILAESNLVKQSNKITKGDLCLKEKSKNTDCIHGQEKSNAMEILKEEIEALNIKVINFS